MTAIGRSAGTLVEIRRTRRLAPGVVAISLLMMLGTLAFVIPAAATADSPDINVCDGIFSISSSVSSQSTSATIYFTPSITPPQYCNLATKITLTWGNSTSYSTTALSSASETAGTQYNYILDFLQPSTTYYYHIHGTSSYGSYDYYGSWGTGSDSSTTISGTVYDAKTGATAPANTIVEVWCIANPNSNYVWGYTSSSGTYSLNVGGLDCAKYGSGGAGAYVASFGYSQGGYWQGHWNETIVVWAPQTVNFYLPENFLSPTLVSYALFTSSSVVGLQFCDISSSTYSYTTSSSITYGVAGLTGTAASSVEVSNTFTSGYCSSTVHEPSNEDWGTFNTTGMLLVNNINGGAVTDVWMSYYGVQHGGGIGSGGPLADPVSEPTSSTGACTTGNINWFHKSVGANSTIQIPISASGTISKLGSDTFSFNIGSLLSPLVDVPGLGEVASAISSTITATSTWGYSWSTSLTNEFSIEATITTGDSSGTFTAACQGSSSSGQGLAIEVWQDS
jgi:hypothetical protein